MSHAADVTPDAMTGDHEGAPLCADAMTDGYRPTITPMTFGAAR
jgi:hypothetical protein